MEKTCPHYIIKWVICVCQYLLIFASGNLVFSHQTCNSSKSNVIPSEELITLLEERNQRLLEALLKLGQKDKACIRVGNGV